MQAKETAETSVRDSPAWSANFVLVYLFFALVLAWLWAASSIRDTYPWLIAGDNGGPAMLGLCGVSIFPAILVGAGVVLCDNSERAARAIGFLAAGAALLVAAAVLLLFVLPYYSTGGEIPYSIFPRTFAPYSWGELGRVLHWLALNLVFPYGPYFGSFALAVLLFDLTCRRRLFTRPAQIVGWLVATSCATLFIAVLPVWDSNLVWFYQNA